MKGPDKDIWFRSLEHEFGRLYQGVGTRIKGTKILTFIPKRKVYAFSYIQDRGVGFLDRTF